MTDIEIARSVKPKNISGIAKKLGLKKSDLIFYGEIKAKIKLDAIKEKKKGKLILVTAINPTKSGIGKTTVSIGLADAFSRLNKRVCLALREPSLGPVFGIKGGATGGGYAQIVPMEDINLHFNGDFSAITAANNLLCSIIDNHIFQGNELNINPETVTFKRCLDVNDRALRQVTLSNERKEQFTITAASEVMAIMCVAENLADLKERLANIIVGESYSGEPVYARDLKAENAMAILLKDALMPNLVQTLEGTPAIVHCGPFANIAHGCNSIIATRAAMSLADYAITEAGFGADLGAEKFIDFKAQKFGVVPDCVVLVATIRALKLHGGVSESELINPNLDALKRGAENLVHHINVIKNIYKLPLVVTLNEYVTDTPDEISLFKEIIEPLATLVTNNVWAEGGRGALDLAKAVIGATQRARDGAFAYNFGESIESKVNSIITKVYGGAGAKLSETAQRTLDKLNNMGKSNLPVIMAKTQFSLTADKLLIGAPSGFTVDIRDFELRNGAGFIVALCGNMLLMPALSKHPAAENMVIDDKTGEISGLY